MLRGLFTYILLTKNALGGWKVGTCKVASHRGIFNL